MNALLPYHQFVTYKLVPRAGSAGKMDKKPTDWGTGAVSDAQDPRIWTTYENAREHSPLVGFALTENDPFWLLDIDSCLQPDGKWSPLALALCAMFAGAFVEVSQSGRGLHIIGTGTIPPHKCKNDVHHLEFYHASRFVAFGRTDQAIGDAGLDCSAALAALVTQYFAPVPDAPEGALPAWTDAPHPEWRGPADDADLIRRARNSKSASSAFGRTASFDQLWTADVDALSAAFPDPERPYDASGADAALARHLAFWTGGDCERIHRIMLTSGLVREKWDRDDYLTRTVLFACSGQKAFCKDTPAESVGIRVTGAATPSPVSGSTFVNVDQQAAVFAGCVYVEDRNLIFTPDGATLDEARFNVRYGGFNYTMDDANTRSSRKAWECFTQSQALRFPRAHSLCFRPELEPGALVQEEGRILFNTYLPTDTLSVSGDPAPFVNLITKMLPDPRDREILLSYCASLVQNPGRKFQYWPVLQGTVGNGKSAVIRCLSHAVGHRYTHLPDVADMAKNGAKFNSWLDRKIFIGIEEIYVPHRRDFLEAFKAMVTNDRIQFEGKGANQVMGDNRANGLMCTNHKDGVPVNTDNRRYCILYTAQQSKADKIRDGMGGTYFPDLYDWFEGRNKYAKHGAKYGYSVVADYLRSYPIAAEFDPAGACHEAPTTSSTREAIQLSRSSIEQEILHAADNGRVGFRDGWASSHFLDHLLKEMQAGRSVPRAQRGALLEGLGYVKHPGLVDGRTNNPVQPDGQRPTLYVREGHFSWSLTGAAAMAAYSAAQGVFTLAAVK